MMQWVLSAVVLTVAIGRGALAQDTTRPMQLADRGPRFLYAPTHGDVPADARGAAVLRKTIGLSVTDVSVADALAVIGRSAGVRIVYKTDVLPAGATVSIDAGHITVAAALIDVLQDIAVDVELTGSGILTLVPRAGVTVTTAHPRLASGGTIAGSIVDSLTGAAVPFVVVRIDETDQVVSAGPQGRYTIADVAPGQYHVTARRVGFIARTKPVTVEDAKVATLNFKLSQPPTRLAEVVTTALGDQRRYEVGNDIATINVDSLAPTAPATSLTDIITSRAPGVQVVETGGLAGSGQAIRIRGQSSMLLQGDPIVIVDGVRQDNTAGGTISGIFGVGVPSPSRLNDIDFTQVETINILKGPSASTEYGTDAANGVIVITTKRGASGKTQWNASADQDGSTTAIGFPEYYYSWGHLTDGSNTPVPCQPIPVAGGRFPEFGPPFNIGSSFGTCAVDSVTHFNPLNHARTSLFGPGLRSKYNLSVAGGSDAIRFYFGGGLSNEVGTVRLPPIFRPTALAYGIPASELKPNTLDQRSLRATTTFRLGTNAELMVTSAYLSTATDMPAQGLNGVSNGQAVIDDSAHQYGYSGSNGPGDRALSPIILLGLNQHEQTDRVTGGATITWRALSWLTAHVTAGIDHGSQNIISKYLPQAEFYRDSVANGSLSQEQFSTDIYSVDARAAATASPFHWLRLTTSLGVQLADTRIAGLVASAQTSPSQPNLNGAGSYNVSQLGNRNATLGGYIEEGFGLFDQFYWSLAMRYDGASGFGSQVGGTTYPKLDLSYPILKRGPTTLRVRTAVGAAGRQPLNGANRQLYDITHTAVYQGTNVGTGLLIGPGNPRLKPERTMEFESGGDVGLWDNRVTVTASAYYKSTKDALIDQILGFDLAAWPYEENIGDIRNTGGELTVSALVVRSRAISWSLTVNAAVNHNKLLRVDPGFTQALLGDAAMQRQVKGYPLYGYWAPRYHYADANHDRVIQYTEISTDTALSYAGSSLPTQEGALSTHVSLLGNGVTIGATFSYAGGFKVFDLNELSADAMNSSLAANDLHVPLADQARRYAGTRRPYVVDGTFVRFRELSLTYAVPVRWVRRVGPNNIGITGGVRNLALWSHTPGIDPETSNQGFTASTSGVNVVNNDVRVNGPGAVPLTRYWFFRVNLGW